MTSTIGRCRLAAARVRAGGGAEPGRAVAPVVAEPRDGGLDLRDDLGLAVPVGDPEDAPERVDDRVERRRLGERDALALVPRRRLAEAPAEHAGEAGFADPGPGPHRPHP